MGINSRSKGAKNERIIAKAFEEWTNKKFAKTPASGGLNWKTQNVAGDIVCCTEGHYFPFVIEGKSYDKIDFSHLLTPGIKNIDIIDFWNQAKRDAVKVNKIPMLLMRYNGLPKSFWFIVMEEDFYIQLPLFAKAFCKVTLKYLDMEGNYKLRIVRSNEFFKTIYKEIKLNAKTYIKKTKAKEAT